MNAVFFKSSGRFGGKLLWWSFLALFPLMAMGTDPIYISPALVTSPPQVDATNFYNAGTWNIFTYPNRYETANTLNYTNKGTMTGSIGWEFDLGAGSSGRTWSVNFLNDNGATISANDVTITTGLAQGELITHESYVLVSATNIVNKGLMNAGAGGEIVLTGSSINLSHSGGLQITPIVGTGSPSFPTNFTPDTSIYDEFWSATNNGLTVGGSPWDGTTLGTYSGEVGIPCGLTSFIQIGPLTPNVVDSVTNALNPWTLTVTNQDASTTSFQMYSNLYHQGVFVYTGSNNLNGQIKFLQTFNPSNGFDIVAIQLALQSTNVVTAQLENDGFYFVDSFAASTNRGLAWDQIYNPAAICGNPTYRPAAYVVSRTVPAEFTDGFSPGLGVPPPTFFYIPPNGGSYFSNLIVLGGAAAAYSCLVDNVAAQVPPGGSITNLPGRVRLYADNLNLNQAHVRAEGEIIVQATNLITSANAIMDCQNLSYNLGSTNGLLNFTNLAPLGVSRLHGTCDMVTGVWSNYVVTVFKNYSISNQASGPPIATESDITNATLIYLSLTAVDASGLLTTVPVTVLDLALHGTNIVVGDSVTVTDSLLLDGLSATLVGDVTLSGGLQNWTYVNAPTLLYLTNNGVLTIPDNAHFGDDRPTNYLAFVNNGMISAGGQNINSANLQINSGGENFCYNGSFVGIAQTAQLTGAIIQSQSDMQFFANNLQLNQQTTLNAVAGAVDLTVTNSLTDGGIGSGNAISCLNGLNLYIKPTKGSLLGTTVMSYAPQNAEVDQYWAGNNLGSSTSGYINNAALGALVLLPEGSQDSHYQPKFAFFGTTGNNGLYVSNLDLSMLTNYYNEVAIDPSITIYYVSVFLNPSVDTGSQTPEQFLNGKQFLDANGNPGGYMQWIGVSSLNKTKPTGYGTMTGSYNVANGKFQLKINSAAGPTNFVIQASSDLKSWVPIYTNSGPFGVYTDPSAGAYPYRFYRTVSGY